MDSAALEANAYSAVDVEAVDSVQDEGERRKHRVFPTFILTTMLIIWILYLYGLFFVIQKSDLHVTLSSPLSPPLRGWYFYTFVHANPLHIAGNTLAAISYGVVFNMYMGFVPSGLVYVLAIFMGSLGHSLLWPYKGLIGCSPGVYGLIGGCWVLLLFHYRRLDPVLAFVLPFAMAAQLGGDVLAYFVYYSSSVGYASHFFGYLTGISVALAMLLGDRRTWRARSRLTRWGLLVSGCIGVAAFVVLAVLLIQRYVEGWPPEALESGLLHNTGDEGAPCCAQLFSFAADNGLSVDEAKSVTYCSDDRLYPFGH